MKIKFFLMWITLQAVLMSAYPDGRLLGQDSGTDALAPAGQPPATANPDPEVDAGNIDKLLETAEKDIGNLSQVDVANHTGSPSLDTQVSTVERRDTTIAKTPAAVYVVTNEMIKRSGARNVPEALRYVPGLQVARLKADCWAIGIRGFDSRFSNMLLVQIDGRAVFSPIRNGVYWEQQFVMLEDVERIEIVRGSGGAIWGVNAVNGIINIITKSSKDTKGIYAEAGGGDQHQVFSSARAGGQQGNVSWRVWGTQNKENHGFLPSGQIPNDGLSTGQGGFRTDWQVDESNLITYQGDWLGGVAGNDESDTKLDAANVLLRWNTIFSEDSDQSIQLYYDYFNQGTARQGLPQLRNVSTFDLDYKYHVKPADRHDVVTGAGFRNYSIVGDSLYYNPNASSLKIFSYFAQDTITLKEDLLYTTFGCKFAHDDWTNFEYQPSWKLVLTPNEKTSMWTSISRSVGIPAMEMRNIDMTIPGVNLRILGNQNLVSEDAMSYEMGLRRQETEKFFWDIAAYFNRYNNLIAASPPVFIPPTLVSVLSNNYDADTYGFEWSANYQVTQSWLLSGNYSFLKLQSPQSASLEDIFGFPINMVNLRSGWDLGQHVNFDLMFRYIDSINTATPNYLLGDIRLAWKPNKHLEAAVVGQNLLAGPHYEYAGGSAATGATQTVPGWYGMLSYRY